MIKNIACAALLAAASTTALAADQFYIGADAGTTKYQDISGHKTSYGVFGGYQFQDDYAVEFGVRQLGKLDVYSVDVDVTQYALSATARLVKSDAFSLYGRLGYNHLNASASANGRSASDSTSGALYGLGVAYDFTPAVSGRFEVQRPSSDSTNVSVGVVYKF